MHFTLAVIIPKCHHKFAFQVPKQTTSEKFFATVTVGRIKAQANWPTRPSPRAPRF